MARKKIAEGLVDVTGEEVVSTTIVDDEDQDYTDETYEDEPEPAEEHSEREWIEQYVPEGLMLQANSLVESEAFGYKSVLKLFHRIAYHAKYKAEWVKGVEMHQRHLDNAVKALDKIFNPRGPRTSSQRIGALAAYSSFSDQTLQHIAAEKGLDYDGRDRDELIDMLVNAQFTE